MATTLPSSYSTVSDVYKTMPYIGSATNITSSDVAYTLGVVEANVNAKLSRVYSLPFTSTPPAVTSIVTDLTIYALARNFALTTFAGKSEWVDRFKSADDRLDDIIAGRMPLLTSALALIQPSEATGWDVWSNNTAYAPTFSELDSTLSVVDPDKIDALTDER